MNPYFGVPHAHLRSSHSLLWCGETSSQISGDHCGKGSRIVAWSFSFKDPTRRARTRATGPLRVC
jgi:hypothetical protein